MQMPEKQKSECPLPGARNQEGVVYQATVENANGEKETYVGLAENFKKRHYKHKSSMERKNPDNTTTLSAHFWAELESGRAPGSPGGSLRAEYHHSTL